MEELVSLVFNPDAVSERIQSDLCLREGHLEIRELYRLDVQRNFVATPGRRYAEGPRIASGAFFNFRADCVNQAVAALTFLPATSSSALSQSSSS